MYLDLWSHKLHAMTAKEDENIKKKKKNALNFNIPLKWMHSSNNHLTKYLINPHPIATEKIIKI